MTKITMLGETLVIYAWLGCGEITKWVSFGFGKLIIDFVDYRCEEIAGMYKYRKNSNTEVWVSLE